MHSAIERLVNEHRVIESVLASLSFEAAAVEEGKPTDRDRLRRFAEFFAGFADRCHHGKEEDLLFAALVAHGMPRERGPVGVMLAEHDEGRRHVQAIARIGRGHGPLSDEERRDFLAHAQAFVPLLGNHIAKEDNVLYPMAVQLLPSDVLDAMIEAFERFEREDMGEGEHERLHALADGLSART